MRMSVNLSARQFADDGARSTRSRDVLAETRLEPGLLELEITESMIMHNVGARGAQLLTAIASSACGSRSTTSAPATRRWRT